VAHQLFLLLVSYFLTASFYSVCMELQQAALYSLRPELVREVAKRFDAIQTMNFVTRTCKKFQEEHPVDALLIDNERVRITLGYLQHAKTMMHAIQKPNETLFEHMVADKKYSNNKKRIEQVLKFFNYRPEAIYRLDCIEKAYKGVGLPYMNYTLKAISEDNPTALFILFENNCVVDVKKFFREEITITYLALHKKRSVARLLLRYKLCDINQQDLLGNTALHYAAMNQDIAMWSLLKGNSAIAIPNNQGKIPIRKPIGLIKYGKLLGFEEAKKRKKSDEASSTHKKVKR